MKKSTKALLIICLLLVLIGSGCMIMGFVMGITTGDLQKALEKYAPFIDWENHLVITDDHKFSFEDIMGGSHEGPKNHSDFLNDKSGNILQYDAHDITSMELDVEGVECRIYTDDTDQIRICLEDDSDVEVKLDHGHLHMDQDTLIHLGKDEVILIYLPDNMIMDSFEVNAGGGKLTILGEIHAKSMDFEVGGAFVEGVGTIKTENLNIEVGAGVVDLQYVDGEEIHLENGAGQTKLSLAGQKEDYNVTINLAAGSVTYGQEKISGIADTYERQPEDAERFLDVDSALGEIVITFKEEI